MRRPSLRHPKPSAGAVASAAAPAWSRQGRPVSQDLPLGGGMRPFWWGLHIAGIAFFASVVAVRALDGSHGPQAASEAFAAHCFSPVLTAARAQDVFTSTGARLDFYDLSPFAQVAPSPALGRPVTPGTDRRCEVAFDGDAVARGIEGVTTGLRQEGITAQAQVPADFPAQPGTQFIAARQLNPNRIAVVQVGTRPGANGIETFINVERLTPTND